MNIISIQTLGALKESGYQSKSIKDELRDNLIAKIKNKEARNAFAARHKCSTKKDRTKAGYWSCNLPRYAEALGLGAKKNTFW